ncbi:hypothetical protein H1R20_g9312, partial [Candolleomyces eurysporus]
MPADKKQTEKKRDTGPPSKTSTKTSLTGATMTAAQIQRLRAAHGKRVAALGREKYGQTSSPGPSNLPPPQPTLPDGPISSDGRCPRMSTGGPAYIARQRAERKRREAQAKQKADNVAP